MKHFPLNTMPQDSICGILWSEYDFPQKCWGISHWFKNHEPKIFLHNKRLMTANEHEITIMN